MKYREIIKAIERDGWRLLRESGSHRHYAHPAKPGIVTIAPHGMNADVPPGTLSAILKQAGLK
ncbi:MAG: type II toxin-antitoxin system HicA family toxin [Vulcanimicrobiaceae bacterium]